MRAIKFRAWNKSRKEMYNVHGWHSGFVFKDTLDGIGTEGNPDRVEDVEIMQFTGLHDVNGQEIYEGDFVECGSDKTPTVVNFDDGCFYVRKQGGRYRLGGFDFNSIDVIGNIHENPELLDQ